MTSVPSLVDGRATRKQESHTHNGWCMHHAFGWTQDMDAVACGTSANISISIHVFRHRAGSKSMQQLHAAAATHMCSMVQPWHRRRQSASLLCLKLHSRTAPRSPQQRRLQQARRYSSTPKAVSSTTTAMQMPAMRPTFSVLPATLGARVGGSRP